MCDIRRAAKNKQIRSSDVILTDCIEAKRKVALVECRLTLDIVA